MPRVTLLSDDIFSIAPTKIRDVKVLKTIVGGRVVWDANAGEVREKVGESRPE